MNGFKNVYQHYVLSHPLIQEQGFNTGFSIKMAPFFLIFYFKLVGK